MRRQFIFQNTKYKLRRQLLRNNPTVAEKKLWEYLKRKKLGYKFTRQYGVGRYVIDFYCPQLKLAIELDGRQHKNKNGLEYDHERNEYLEYFGIKTLRFLNKEVMEEVEKVLDRIISEVCS